MTTKRIDPRFADLDLWPTGDIVAAMWEAQLAAVASMAAALPVLSAAVAEAAQRLGSEGRIVYVGAGTSGRLGAQDGTELTPTFHWPAERVLYLLAGGAASLTRSAERAEDDAKDAVRQIKAAAVGKADVMIGLAAIVLVSAVREPGEALAQLWAGTRWPLMTFIQKPISAVCLVLAAIALLAAVLPGLSRQRGAIAKDAS